MSRFAQYYELTLITVDDGVFFGLISDFSVILDTPMEYTLQCA